MVFSEDVLTIVTIVAGMFGGATGAYLARTAAWKGAAIALAAAIAQMAAIYLFQFTENWAPTLIYLVTAALAGGRYGLGLSMRQIVHVLLGAFIFAVGFGVAYVHLAASPLQPTV